jgi:hypothetical protein
MKHLFTILAIALLTIFQVYAQGIVPAKNAAKHTGQKVTICDKVYSTGSKSNATLLYLGGDYPHQLLTVVVKTSDLAKFKGHPITDLKGKDVCVTGVVINNKGKSEIAVNSPQQLKMMLVDSPVGKRFN